MGQAASDKLAATEANIRDNPQGAATTAAAAYFGGPLVGGALGGAAGGAGGLLAGAGGILGGQQAAAEHDTRLEDLVKQAQQATTTTTTDTDQTVGTTTDATSQTTFADRSPEEQQLLDASIGAFTDQQGLVGDLNDAIAGREGLQTGARDTIGGILGGEAFGLTGLEQGRIGDFREASLASGRNNLGLLLDERLQALKSDAARRGLRGQAAEQLKGQALGITAQQATAQQLAANQIAAQQAIDLPGQRVGTQLQAAQPLTTFQEDLTQQQIANQGLLQDPIALQALLDERLKGGKTSQTGSTDTTTTGTDTETKVGQGFAPIFEAQTQAPGPTGAASQGLGAVVELGGKVLGMGTGGGGGGQQSGGGGGGITKLV